MAIEAASIADDRIQTAGFGAAAVFMNLDIYAERAPGWAAGPAAKHMFTLIPSFAVSVAANGLYPNQQSHLVKHAGLVMGGVDSRPGARWQITG